MKKLLSCLLSLTMIICMLITVLPATKVNAATTTVRVKDLKTNTTGNYTKLAQDYLYVNGTKINMVNIPIFMRGGAYMGSLAKIFKNSSLNVKVVDSNDNGVGVEKLTYGNKVLIIREGTRVATLNGKSVTLSAVPFRAYYTANKVTRWVVPIWSICNKLGINYTRTTSGIIKIGTTSTSGSSSNSSSKKQIVLCIDAGHGGSDSGAVGNGLREKALTLSIVLSAKKYFDANSRFKVYYTRISDTYPSLTARSSLANSKNADLFLCIHINSYLSTSVGTETLYNASRLTETKKNGITSYQLAAAMQKATVAATGFPNRGLVNRTGLSVLNHTNMPACLIEYGFISNPSEATLMYRNTSKYGQALYNGVVSFCKTKGLY